ncbi:SAM-dependent methyltransferase [Alsobacter metallidurans]|uniref:SAM-dependent methyltransferase n=2 Tax=Alsobacter metallidurans TaxID=340221 RepID=A0A917MHY4_9HYPH|nr:SAM-dependent methyltransferase [Alsobacter metallidurans]
MQPQTPSSSPAPNGAMLNPAAIMPGANPAAPTEAAPPAAAPLDGDRLNAFVGKMLGDMGAVFSGALVLMGDKLGLYKAMANAGPIGPQQLALRTQTDERYVREWLSAMAASGYMNYDPKTERYTLSPEQAAVLADENSPAFMAGAFDIASAMYRDEPKITAAFKSGRGVGWHDHSQCLFRGTERFFKTSYRHHLVDEWLPALEGVVEKLRRGARVADVGCGHGASTIIMAQAFPNSRFFGFDYHDGSIEQARAAAMEAGVAGQCEFAVADARSYPAMNYDLITFFDCLHDMGDPVGAARHARSSMAADGTWMIVEPMAGDKVEDNLNPVGRIYYAASTMLCTPASKSQDVGLALGAQAGERRLAEVIRSGGFGRVRAAATTPFNMVLEARP